MRCNVVSQEVTGREGGDAPCAGAADAKRCANASELPVFDPYITYSGLKPSTPAPAPAPFAPTPFVPFTFAPAPDTIGPEGTINILARSPLGIA